VVVDAFDPCVLASSCATKVFDFLTVKEESLHSISIPLDLEVSHLGSRRENAEYFTWMGED
jgi:hypothetical protein